MMHEEHLNMKDICRCVLELGIFRSKERKNGGINHANVALKDLKKGYETQLFGRKSTSVDKVIIATTC